MHGIGLLGERNQYSIEYIYLLVYNPRYLMSRFIQSTLDQFANIINFPFSNQPPALLTLTYTRSQYTHT